MAVSAALVEEAQCLRPRKALLAPAGAGGSRLRDLAVLAGVRFYNQDELFGCQLAQQAGQPA